jgi:hypothetical protein
MSILTGPVMATPAKDSLTRSATALADVGSRAFGELGEFIYVTAAEAITTSGFAVSASGALSAVKTGNSSTGAFLGCAEAPFASGESGYIRIAGPCSMIVDSGAVAGDSLQISATAGHLKKTTTSGDQCAIALAASDNASTAAIAVFLV